MKRQVEFVFPEVVFLRMVLKPGKLQFKIGLRISDIADHKGTVCRIVSSLLGKPECFFIKRKRPVKIRYIVVFMVAESIQLIPTTEPMERSMFPVIRTKDCPIPVISVGAI